MDYRGELKRLEAEEQARREEYERRRAALKLLRDGNAPELAIDAVAEMLQPGPPPPRMASKSGQLGRVAEIWRDRITDEELRKAAYEPTELLPQDPVGRVYGYVCLSAHDTNLAEFQAAIQAYCAKKGWHLEGICWEEAQYETKRFDDRPYGKKLTICSSRGDQIIFARHDRGFRDPVDMADTVEWLTIKGVVVHLCDWQISTDMAWWKIGLPIFLGLPEWEQRPIKERIRRGIAERKRQRQRWTRNAPPGYCWKRDPNGGRTKRGKPLMVLATDPAQIEEMRLIAELHEKHGLSFYQIWQRFHYTSRFSSHTCAEWTVRTVAWRYEQFKKQCQTLEQGAEVPGIVHAIAADKPGIIETTANAS